MAEEQPNSNLLNRVCQYAQIKSLDFFDLRAERYTGLFLEATEGRIKNISSPFEQGFGFRALVNGAWGFAVAKKFDFDVLKEAVDRASTLAKLASERVKETFEIAEQPAHVDDVDLGVLEQGTENIEEKILKTLELNQKTKDFDPRLHNVQTFFSERTLETWIFNSFGTQVNVKTPLFRLFTNVFAQEGGILQQATKTTGFVGTWGDMQDWEKHCTEPAENAVRLLSAQAAPSGTFTIIMNPSLTGTFTHEALGHASEADAIIAKESILEGRLGEKVAAPEVTIVDDATIRESYGYYPYDDEGTPGQRKVIVNHGVLGGYLTSLESASRLDLPVTGNARAQSTHDLPLVRMSATVLQPGDFSLDELIAEVKQGILAIDWLYGYVDPVKGEFEFKTKGGYLIENGEKTTLIRDVALSGLTLETLKNVTGIGNEVEYADGVCGKGGQGVRVGDGGPYTRIENVRVGGMG
ncbi:MAG TPA: TldD/PmbA family protein [Candidatus Lokiarchaeia archaeon]|nr:TldD/PmbA family protein [Candidatus Lokiarchaeia archaeon]